MTTQLVSPPCGLSTHIRRSVLVALRLSLAGILAGILAVVLVGAGPARAKGEHCRDFDPEKNVYWGDLHIHTSYSMDAYMFDARLTPRDAYAFAKGKVVRIAPLDEDGRGTVPFQIDRPLDFAAVTDHSEALGGVQICTNPKHPNFDSETCVRYRSPLKRGSVAETATDIHDRIESLRSEPLCGKDWSTCREALRSGWQEIQAAAAEADDATNACSFTSLVAYEHTNTPNLTKIHRNVIFANEKVPEFPVTAADEPDPVRLWERLERECKAGVPGCDVLAIPHNPNLSNGHIFTIEYPENASLDDKRRYASLRARMEPVTEIMQIKGESECRSGFWKVVGTDEDCNFEKIRGHEKTEDCHDETGEGALGGKGCESRLDFARYALIEGLRQAEEIGVNPLAFGQIGSTDIHAGTPGATAEWQTETFDGRMKSPGYNLGGVAAIWAEENSREALFGSLRRREVYATSGPRVEVRFFGGWDLPTNLCGKRDLVKTGYAKGVPMGGDLPARRGRAKGGPRFVVTALRDAGTPAHPGNLLQRVQIIKGWADADGTFHQEVVDVAGRRNNGATVDTQSCQPKGPGENQLCAVWSDPKFDPAKRAVYYARVLENPSCRFSTHACNALKGEQRPAMCDDPMYPKTIQERAWTSPIWYTPPDAKPAQAARAK